MPAPTVCNWGKPFKKGYPPNPLPKLFKRCAGDYSSQKSLWKGGPGEPSVSETGCAQRFVRDTVLVAELRSGHIFDYARLVNVSIRCNADKAAVIAEHTWFDGQQTERQADGSLILHFSKSVPYEPTLWWVLSYVGSLEVLTPPSLRNAVYAAASSLQQQHAPEKKLLPTRKIYQLNENTEVKTGMEKFLS